MLPRFVIRYFIGFSFIILFNFTVILANKLPLNSDDIKPQKYNNRWEFENGAEKIERREEGQPVPTVTIPKEGPFHWKWTWNSKVNTTSTSEATTTTTRTTTTTGSPTTSKPRVYALRPAARKSLRNALRGTTPEKRKKQLAQMGKKMKINKISKSQSNKLHKTYRKVKISENPPALDMFEVNEQAGLNAYLFQGDINLDDKQIAEFTASAKSSSRRKRQIQNSALFWPDKTVYYYFDPGLGTNMQHITTEAMEYLQQNTCVKFVMDSTATNRVKVGTAAHELSHTLGVFHTQMRSDRDEYVTIDLTDVSVSSEPNFYKMTAEESTNLVDYEYGSFMHYSGRAFSTGVDSIVPKDPVMVYTMGGRVVSFLDIKMLNEHYTCSCPSSLNCANGGYSNPSDCTVCICPWGFGGTLCDERADTGCGSELTATDTWQQSNYSFGDPTNSQTARPRFMYCTHWIKAPVGKQIQFRIDAAQYHQCQYACPFGGLEPKLKSDVTVTQARYCCNEFFGEVMTAETNPLPVFAFSRYYISVWSWSYRYVDATPTSCVDLSDAVTCLALKASYDQGCSLYDTAQLKVMCAVTMDLCGKTVSGSGTCQDRFPKSQCSTYSSNGMCTSQLPLIAEFSCASTCGFCVNPV